LLITRHGLIAKLIAQTVLLDNLPSGSESFQQECSRICALVLGVTRLKIKERDRVMFARAASFFNVIPKHDLNCKTNQC